ncbi:spermidine/spermine N(1)-acetyltransferase-like protein 1 isoform X2 [Octopus bimaculoides]|uniref:spermidine/spermine N(1)-acetyltransferase-like protein 1 isoform X2 n=1 Tax=Octopus bimaculoides TaxID=37653 RepID=UPI0022E20A0F|nr:spermidine/spermine N(1)-acetyltransferase-like protein 1 isoform X2 [Octopus bimaculoides]
MALLLHKIRHATVSDCEDIVRLLQEQEQTGKKRKPLSVDELKTHCFDGENSFNILIAEMNNKDSSKNDNNIPLVGYLLYNYHFCVFDSKSLRITDVYVSEVTEHKENILRDLVGHLVKIYFYIQMSVQEECDHIRWTVGNNNYLENITKYFEAFNMSKDDGWFFFKLGKSQVDVINKGS